jgi:hypothetical protein
MEQVGVRLPVGPQSLIPVPPTHAAISSWDKGANIVPQTQTDFSSDSFKQSLTNLKNTGANFVALVVPYYQSNTSSSDIAPGWNTPTDASLAAAIDYAHSLGLQVAIKVFDEPYTNAWRAYISPTDRDTWYSRYGSNLVHIAQIAQTHHVELMILGTEMVSVASSQINPDNTQRWLTMISNVRAVYSGKLTYGANSNDTNNDTFVNEKKYVGFWSALDYAGLSTYYQLQGSDVSSLKGSWDYWNKNDIMAFQRSIGKPILFTEVGYRSVDNAHSDPWNAGRGGAYNATEQSNDYEALMSYWNDYSYMQGVFWWDWSSNPNAGGAGDTTYTVQNKPAQSVLTKWFTTPTTPTQPPTQTAFTSTGSYSPNSPTAGAQVTLSASLHNLGGAFSGLVDIEVYNSGGTKVFQQFYAGESFAADQTRSFNASWTASPQGAYHMAVGVFNNTWTQNYHWNNNAVTINVGQTSTTPPPPSTGSSYVTDIWWPSDGGTVSGVQPFKAMLEGLTVSQYSMYWQVDGGTLNVMSNSTVDYPHKEVLVNVGGWTWKGSGPYTVNFVSKDGSGNIIGQKSIRIYTSQ